MGIGHDENCAVWLNSLLSSSFDVECPALVT